MVQKTITNTTLGVVFFIGFLLFLVALVLAAFSKVDVVIFGPMLGVGAVMMLIYVFFRCTEGELCAR